MLAFFRFIKFYNEGEITMVSVENVERYMNTDLKLQQLKGATPGNQHWVAVTGVNNDNVIMVDPASNQTDMWSAYEWSKSSQFNYFKAE